MRDDPAIRGRMQMAGPNELLVVDLWQHLSHELSNFHRPVNEC